MYIVLSGLTQYEEHGHKMKPLPHLYEVSLSGGPTDYATLSAAGLPPLRSAPPKEFDGPGDAWSPEQLLVCTENLNPDVVVMESAKDGV
jgi:hypothetical protein